MRITDIVDITTLQKLNGCLQEALGVTMTLVDAHGVPVNGHGEHGQPDVASVFGDPAVERLWGSDSESIGEAGTAHVIGAGAYDLYAPSRVAIPLRVGGQRIGALYVESTRRDDYPDTDNAKAFGDLPHSGEAIRTHACEVLERAPCAYENAVGLGVLVAQLITDSATENLRMRDEASRCAAAALHRTAEHETLQRIAENVPVGLLSVDRHGEITWLNKPAKELLGLSPNAVPESRSHATVCTVASIDDAAPADSYARITRRLVRGETVRGIRCVLCRSDGSSFEVRVDAAPAFSRKHRIDRVFLALHPADEADPGRGGSRPSWNEVRAILNVVNARAATRRAGIAHELQRGVVDELECAWLELDSLRQELRRADRPAISGRLDTVASRLKQAATNAVMLRSECWPQVWDQPGVASAIECRLGEIKAGNGMDCTFEDRSNGRHPLNADRCTMLYRVAEEILADAVDFGHRVDVVLDANEYYWLLMVSANGNGSANSSCSRSGAARAREQLRAVAGTLETVQCDDGRVVHYVILPTAG